MKVIAEYQERINAFLSSILNESPSHKAINPKIIHDSVWGTHTFNSWEVGLIDSPVLQRLRRIHQTGLAYLVFPTATHTRFEHSLGVTTLVENLVNHLNNNKKSEFISEKEKFDLRLSALLHDVGHSFFSHVSEMIYSRMSSFQELLDEIISTYKVKPKGHELFSFLIVKSYVFQDYFLKLVTYCKISDNMKSHEEYLEKVDWDTIAGWIIGYSSDPKKKYLADIINGPFDCDKLDYLARDAKFAGPVIVYDIDRFYYTLDTLKIAEFEHLTVTLGGITALEQILISRMMMFSYIYHHHKVRASEAMLKRLCFDIINEKTVEIAGSISIKLNHPVDFLKYSDEVILSSYADSYNIPAHAKSIIADLLNRNLWVRSNFVSDFNLEDCKCNPNYTSLEEDLHFAENVKELKDFKREIINAAMSLDSSIHIELRDIWIDVPKPPNADEANRVKIKKNHKSEESVSLVEVFPITAWIDAYKAQKWRSHIFCRKEHQSVIHEASTKVIYDSFKMKIQPYTKNFCKIGE